MPEQNVNMKAARLLIIINVLAYSSKGNFVLDIEKLAVFEFLSRYPTILKQLKKLNADKDVLYLMDYEVGNIESNFPNNDSLYNYDYLKSLIKVLAYYKFIDVQFYKSKVYYSVTSKGNDFKKELNTPYLKRVNELCEAMLSLRSVKTIKLKQMIKFIMEGMENEHFS
jgi:hypothetical protein